MQIILSSDEPGFGGWNNVTKDADVEFITTEGDFDGRPHSFQAYLPCRTVTVYSPAEWVDAGADGKKTGVLGLGVKDKGPYYSA
jgi:1,4-alpha-glucan branching enzyme